MISYYYKISALTSKKKFRNAKNDFNSKKPATSVPGHCGHT